MQPSVTLPVHGIRGNLDNLAIQRELVLFNGPETIRGGVAREVTDLNLLGKKPHTLLNRNLSRLH